MPATMKSLGIDKLPRDERITLAMDIWDSVAVEGPLPLSEAMKRELDRRIAEADEFPDEGIPWEEVKARLDGRFNRIKK